MSAELLSSDTSNSSQEGDGSSSKRNTRFTRAPLFPVARNEAFHAPPVERAAIPAHMIDRLVRDKLIEEGEEAKKKQKKIATEEHESAGIEQGAQGSAPSAEANNVRPTVELGLQEGEEGTVVLGNEQLPEDAAVEASSDESPTPPELPSFPDIEPVAFADAAEPEPTNPLSTPPSGGSGTPPPPPGGPPPFESGMANAPEPDPPMRGMASIFTPPSPNVAYGSAPNLVGNVAEQLQNALGTAEYVAEKRGLRRGLVAGFITGYLVKAYLARRKQERYQAETDKAFKKHDQQMSELQDQNHSLQERVSAQSDALERQKYAEQEPTKEQAVLSPAAAPQRFERMAPAQPEAAPVPVQQHEQIFDQEGNEIILQPGWRVERSAGGYSVVLNERNQVMYEAIRYGKEYQQDRKHEQVSDTIFDSDSNAAAAQAVDDAFAAVALPQLPAQDDQTNAAYQYARDQQAGQFNDLQRSKPGNQLKATVTSPWLWTAVAILIIIYFIAALA